MGWSMGMILLMAMAGRRHRKRRIAALVVMLLMMLCLNGCGGGRFGGGQAPNGDNAGIPPGTYTGILTVSAPGTAPVSTQFRVVVTK